MSRITLPVRLVLLLVLASTGCKKPKPESRPTQPVADGGPAVDNSPAVATFGGQRITLAQFQKYFDAQSPFVQTHYQSQDGKNAILDIMIETQLLANEAIKKGYEHDDEALTQLRKGMIRQWRRATFESAEARQGLPEADLRAYYDAHRNAYQRPEQVRVQMIFFKADPAHEAAARAEAETAFRSLSKQKGGAFFAHLAQTRSDDSVSRSKGGDLDFRTREDLAKSYGEPVAAAAMSLTAPGQVSPVVQGTGGFYLLQLEGRIPADERSFEKVEPEIRAELWEERRVKLYQDFVKNLMDKAQIQINDAELAKVNQSTSPEKAPEPAYPGPPPSLEEELRQPLPPYREYPGDNAGPVVAAFGGHTITRAELDRYFDEQEPIVRTNFRSEKAKRGLVEEMIKAQLLVDEAVKGNFQHDEIAQVYFRRSMIGEWMEDNYNDQKGEAAFTEDEVRAYYKAHGNGHQLDPVRVRMIFFKTSPDREAAVQREAEAAYRSLSGSKEQGAFAHLAETRSDDSASRARGGNLDVVSHEELATLYGEPVASAVDALNTPQAITRPVHGNGGIYLLQLEERLPMFDHGVEASDKVLRAKMWNDRRNKLLDDYMNKLKAQGDIQIDQAELAKVKPNPAILAEDAPPAASTLPPLPWSRLNTPLAPIPETAHPDQAKPTHP